MTIHKEGYASLALVSAVLFVVNLSLQTLGFSETVLTVAYVLSALLFITVLQFFRKPARTPNLDENLILAPADGKVVVIEKAFEDEFLKEDRMQVSIFMSPINVHSNLNPVSGRVKYFKYHPGKFLVAWHPKSSTENERTSYVLENEKGSMMIRQIAGALARRICWYVKEGQPVTQADEFGFIKFGSRVDLFLPLDAKIEVNLDQTTTGGQTVIARWA